MRQGFLTRAVDRFIGRGSAAVTVPALDGALKPNNLLEDLPAGIGAQVPDDMAVWQGGVVWSDGACLMSQGGILGDLGSAITALAATKDSLAVATLSDGVVILDTALNRITPNWKTPLRNVTALDFAPDGKMWFCIGSELNPPGAWRRDLMEKNRSGMVGQTDPATGAVQVIRRRLGYPCGIAVMPEGAVVFSEAWSSHLVEIALDGATQKIVLDEIPGYPGRLLAREAGGYWLCVFAPRSPLIEFVLREPAYRTSMLAEVPPDYWVAPNYASGRSFHEPMQGGALKQMGILKPWAPTLSYGLVVELDAQFNPIRSFHSRAGGRRHGITSVCEVGPDLWLTARGAGEVLKMPLATEGASA